MCCVMEMLCLSARCHMEQIERQGAKHDTITYTAVKVRFRYPGLTHLDLLTTEICPLLSFFFSYCIEQGVQRKSR
jgi:hypothetical protein